LVGDGERSVRGGVERDAVVGAWMPTVPVQKVARVLTQTIWGLGQSLAS
jgi:hypothetical protein